MNHVIFENDRFQVIEYHLRPGATGPMHSHPNGLMVYWFSDAKMRILLDENGKVDESSTRPGDIVWRDPVIHKVEDLGTADAHVLLFEPKVFR